MHKRTVLWVGKPNYSNSIASVHFIIIFMSVMLSIYSYKNSNTNYILHAEPSTGKAKINWRQGCENMDGNQNLTFFFLEKSLCFEAWQTFGAASVDKPALALQRSVFYNSEKLCSGSRKHFRWVLLPLFLPACLLVPRDVATQPSRKGAQWETPHCCRPVSSQMIRSFLHFFMFIFFVCVLFFWSDHDLQAFCRTPRKREWMSTALIPRSPGSPSIGALGAAPSGLGAS